MKPYYEESGVTIFHADCRDVLPEWYGDGTPPSVLTDPPYNLGVDYDGYSDSLDEVSYLEFMREWWAWVEGPAIVFPGLSNLPGWCRHVERPLAVGCWYSPGNPGRGFPWSNVEWEPFLVYRTGMLGGSNVYRSTISSQRDVGDHPCPKPLSLFRALLSRMKPEEVVDPFMGSGTTLRAAKDLGINAIGIDQSERYCEIAAKRLAQEVLDFGPTRSGTQGEQ